MTKPTLTIDFLGLCAFVADPAPPAAPTRIHVLLLDAKKAVPGDGLCRHDPVLVYRQKHFRGRGDYEKDQRMFPLHFPELSKKKEKTLKELRDQNVGILDLREKIVTLGGADTGSTSGLTLGKTFQEILRLDQLIESPGAAVKAGWLNGGKVPGIAARMTIEHGELTGGPHLSEEWALDTLNGKPSNNPATIWIRFRQSVRWKIFAKPTHRFLSLETGQDEWINLGRGGHVVISNLCPLSNGGGPVEKDVLVYYELAKAQVTSNNRRVLHRRPTGAAPAAKLGTPVAPSLGACPPLTATL